MSLTDFFLHSSQNVSVINCFFFLVDLFDVCCSVCQRCLYFSRHSKLVCQTIEFEVPRPQTQLSSVYSKNKGIDIAVSIHFERTVSVPGVINYF